ncbi:hypothetical protein DFJ73DRAFT_896103, partial [Zopfochytrium polystomum]
PANHKERRNPRYARLLEKAPIAASGDNGKPVLIRNATVWDGVGNQLTETDVLLSHGLIADDHADTATIPRFTLADVQSVDATGRYVTPGLVDQHSHVGVGALPNLDGNADGNELYPATLPQVRALDAIDAQDPGFDAILSGGVTTSLILPGSALLMGGEAVAVKMLRTGTNEPEDLLLNLGAVPGGTDGKTWRWLKMACGENPKRVSAEFAASMPFSRMGNGWLFRERFEEARALLRRQDDWCEAAGAAERRFGRNAHRAVAARYPDDLVNESLVALLRGDVRLNVHCYEPHDIEMMVRNKHEFNFEIATFHHATGAHLVAPLLARENISAAIFSEFSLYKKEAFTHSVRAGQILHEAGVKVAYKSDHWSAVHAQMLMQEAAKAHHYGVDRDVAFAAVTSVPAERLGAGWRLGRLAEGYDADVVVWDREPMQLGAQPLRVYVDGFLGLEKEAGPRVPATVAPEANAVTPQVQPALDEPVDAKAYTVTNVSAIYAGPGALQAGSIVVEDGVVTCVGGGCKPAGIEFNLNGGSVIPGLIVANIPIGLAGIDMEEITADGLVDSATALGGLAHAADGIRVGGGAYGQGHGVAAMQDKLLQYAFRSGVLTAITPPRATGMVAGFSTAFRTGAKEPSADSVTAQLGRLRSLLAAGATHPHSPFATVANGTHALVVSVDDASDIEKVLAIVSDSKARVVIAGGAGARKAAGALRRRAAVTAATGGSVSVLLQPARCVPATWEQRECAEPFARPTTAEVLLSPASSSASSYLADAEAPVTLGLSVEWPNKVRALRHEAGFLVADSVTAPADVVSVEAAVGAVTWAVADAFFGASGPLDPAADGVGRVKVGTRANFVAVNARAEGVLSAMAARVQIVADGARVVTLPTQD